MKTVLICEKNSIRLCYMGKLCLIASSRTGATMTPDPATARQQLSCPMVGKLARPWCGHRTANPVLINFTMRLMDDGQLP